MVAFEEMAYIYPPRSNTCVAITSDTAKNLANSKAWIAQLKLNGQRNLIYHYPGGKIEFYGRHNSRHLNYAEPDWLLDQIRDNINIDRDKFSVIDGELLHAKHPTMRNTLYLWDVLVLNGQYLLGTKYLDRYDMLFASCLASSKQPGKFGPQISSNIVLAENIMPESWGATWDKFKSESIIEGLVFKCANGILRNGFTESNNSEWQIRCRKSAKTYSH